MSTTSLGRAGLSATEKRALLAELLRKKAAENASNFPLSYGQKALLYLSRLDPDTPTYNAMFAIRLDAEVSIEALRTALQGIIDRHAAFRTSYVVTGERSAQPAHAARKAARPGKQSKLSPLKCQFSDYVQWQRDMLASPRGEQLFRYWERELAGEVPALNLPADRVRPMIQTYHGSSFRFSLEPGIVGHL